MVVIHFKLEITAVFSDSQIITNVVTASVTVIYLGWGGGVIFYV